MKEAEKIGPAVKVKSHCIIEWKQQYLQGRFMTLILFIRILP